MVSPVSRDRRTRFTGPEPRSITPLESRSRDGGRGTRVSITWSVSHRKLYLNDLTRLGRRTLDDGRKG